MSAKTPQKNTSTQIETTIFLSRRNANKVRRSQQHHVEQNVVPLPDDVQPGACPLAINCASQALYAWLARSPASTRRCQTHGATSIADKNSHMQLAQPAGMESHPQV